MKRHYTRVGSALQCVAAGLLLGTAGCTDRSNSGQPPTQAQIQQQNSAILNDSHVPDAVKQHLKEQQASYQANARGYTDEQHQKQTGNK